MTCVMRLLGIGGGPLLPEGTLLVECDVDARGGRGTMHMTNDIDKARLFDTARDALDYWRRQSTVRPTRDDGQPNRPATAFTVEIIDAALAAQGVPSPWITDDDEGPT